MSDELRIAAGIADVRDAIARIRAVLPASSDAFVADRTAREVVILNLFVALQQTLDLASHWLAQGGRSVPSTYRDILLALGEAGLLEQGLAARLAAAAGLRNLIAHRYGVLDYARVYAICQTSLEDLAAFSDRLAKATRER